MLTASIAVGRCMEPTIVAGDVLHWDYGREPNHGDIVLAHLIRDGKTRKIAKYLDTSGSVRMLRSETGLSPLDPCDEIVAVLDSVERPASITPELKEVLDNAQRELDEYADTHDDGIIKFWSLYRLDTGALTGSVLGMRRVDLAMNIPPDCDVVLGKFNHQTHRVNLQTKTAEPIEMIACGDLQPNAVSSTYNTFAGSVSWTTTTTDFGTLTITASDTAVMNIFFSFTSTAGNTTFTGSVFKDGSLFSDIASGYINPTAGNYSGNYSINVDAGHDYSFNLRGLGTGSGTNSVENVSITFVIQKR